jgi:hypothetical protein
MPLYRREAQSTPFHFLTKSVGELLGCVTNDAIAPPGLSVSFDLTANAFVIVQEGFVFRVCKVHWCRPAP